MTVPPAGIVVPTLAPLELSYAGLAFGGVDRLQRFNLQGWTQGKGTDLPPYISGDQQRAIDQGEFAGIDLSGGRDLENAIIVKGGNATELDAAIEDLTGVLPPQGEVELPLYYQTASGLRVCMARPRGCSYANDVSRYFANAVVATCQWHATDPRWYSAPTRQQRANVPGPIPGVTFDVTFDVNFGGGHYGEFLTVLNNGKYPCSPTLVIVGPCVNPRITNLTLSGAPTIEIDITLNAGDQLTIDTDFRTVQLVAAGTTQAVSRRNLVASGSIWWNIQPAPVGPANLIRFVTGDIESTTGSLTVLSADAWLAF